MTAYLPDKIENADEFLLHGRKELFRENRNKRNWNPETREIAVSRKNIRRLLISRYETGGG